MSPKIGYPLMVIWILACLWGFTYLGKVVMGLTATSVWALLLMITGTTIVVSGVLWLVELIDQYKERNKNETSIVELIDQYKERNKNETSG